MALSIFATPVFAETIDRADLNPKPLEVPDIAMLTTIEELQNIGSNNVFLSIPRAMLDYLRINGMPEESSYSSKHITASSPQDFSIKMMLVLLAYEKAVNDNIISEDLVNIKTSVILQIAGKLIMNDPTKKVVWPQTINF
jgi:hypothetical protein